MLSLLSTIYNLLDVNKMKNLYIKDPDTTNLKNFIKNNFLELGTFYSYSRWKETYSDKECTKQQCHVARRSFEDLLRLVNTYFPNTSPKKLYNVLKNTKGMCVNYCYNIYKNVFFVSGNSNKLTIYTQNKDKKGKGKWSIKMLEEL